MNNVSLKDIFQKINYRFTVDEFISLIDQKELKTITELDYSLVNNRVLTEFFNSFYFYAKQMFPESLKSSYSVCEFLIRDEYSKTAVNANSMSSKDLLKWAINRSYISKKNFNYLQGIRITRNKIVHHMSGCLPEEAKLSMFISISVIKFFSEKNK